MTQVSLSAFEMLKKSKLQFEEVLIFKGQNLKCVLIELRLDTWIAKKKMCMDLYNQLSIVYVFCIDLLLLTFLLEI